MYDYLELLSIMKSDIKEQLNQLGLSYLWKSKYEISLNKVISYVKNEITLDNIKNDNEEELFIFCTVVNKILNFEYKDKYYYIELPNNETNRPTIVPSILAANIKYIGTKNNVMNIIGPSEVLRYYSSFSGSNYVEIEGEFSDFSDGVVLPLSDYLQIILKYPYLDKKIREEALKQNNKSRLFNQDDISRLYFVVPTQYLSKEQIKKGDDLTFEMLDKLKKKDVLKKEQYKKMVRERK